MIVHNRFVKPALVDEGNAQIVQRVGVIRIELDGLGVALYRFVKPALGGKGGPQTGKRVLVA